VFFWVISLKTMLGVRALVMGLGTGYFLCEEMKTKEP